MDQMANQLGRRLFVLSLLAIAVVAKCAWALPGTTNLSLLPTATATATGADFGASIEDAIDGNRDGNFGNGSVFYANAIAATEENPNPPPLFYEVDLGVNAYIDRVQVLRRTDADQGVFGNFRLTIYEDDGAGNPGNVAFTQEYLPFNFEHGTWATTEPGASATGGALGRHVRFERIDNNYWLTFAEFEVIGATTPLTFTESNNIAARKPVTTSSPPGFGALISSGNDSGIDSNFGFPGHRPVYHSSTVAIGEYWQVDLGEVTQLDHLQLFTRGDHYSTSEFKVSVLDASQAVVDSLIVVNNPLTDLNPGYDHLVNTAGAMGQYIRIETTKEEHLVFTELRAFEGPGSTFPTGDYNQNGVVDEGDYTAWKLAYGTANPAADGNGDGIVDAADYTVWRDNLASGSGGGSLATGAVPEPATLVLLLVGSVFAFGRRR
jgi:hypothetical protein